MADPVVTVGGVTTGHMNITYALSDFHGAPSAPVLAGQTLTFGMQLTTSSGFADLLTLTYQNSTFIALHRVTNLPSQSIVQLHLDGNYATFNTTQQTAFIDAMAVTLGVDPRNIRILSVASGSIIITLTIQDDVVSQVKSSAAVTVLSGQSTLGGFPVISVVNMTPGSSGGSSTGGGGGGGAGSGSAAQIPSQWSLLSMVVVALLILCGEASS